MKKLVQFLPFVSLLLIAGCENSENPSTGYTLSGTVNGATQVSVTLNAIEDNNLVVVDSVVTDGAFTFTGQLDAPEMHYLRVGDSRQMISLFLENSDMEVSFHVDSMDQAQVSGSALQEKYDTFEEAQAQLYEEARQQYYAAQEALQQGDSLMFAALREQATATYSRIDSVIKAHIFANTDNAMGPMLAVQTYFNDEELQEADSVLGLFEGEATETQYYSDMSSMIEKWKQVAVGQPALDFVQNDTIGNPVRFSDIEGKYILIDFWASWCGPCRAENPNVVKMYEEYNEKGFEIVGVSLDESHDKWVEAIDKDELEWVHVSDLKGWDNVVSNDYGVKAIPHTVLVDPNGIIIAKNLRGESLREKLEELLP